MITRMSLGCVSIVALLAGAAYAGNNGCCSPSRTVSSSREIRTESSNGSYARISGNPCSPCATKASACGERKACKPAKCEQTCEVKCEQKCCKVDADIEKLRVINPECSTDLCIAYQVDIECGPDDQFDLLVQLKCRDQIVYEKLIPLENGAPGNETGEWLFAANFQDQLPEVYNNGGRSHLRAEANVVRRGTTVSLDREREHVSTGESRGILATTAGVFTTTADVITTPVRWLTRY